MEKRLCSSLHSSVDDFLSSAVKLSLKSSKTSLKTLIHSISPSSSPSATLPSSIHRLISNSIASFQNLGQPSPPSPPPRSPETARSPPSKRHRRSSRRTSTSSQPSSPLPPPRSPETSRSPPSKRPRRSSRRTSTSSSRRNESGSSHNETNTVNEKQRILEGVQVLAYLTFLCVSHPKKPFPAGELLPAAQLLHDNLVLFESDSNLLSEISNLCEECWKVEFSGRELLISQSLPYLLSRSLTLKKKVDVHRVYALREAFSLFDFEDESIEDLKLLLMRCLIAPLYLKTEDGKKFLAFVLGLSKQVLKEALAMMKSQIPFGRKSMLEAYGEILFRAWKGVQGDLKDEIESGFLQTLIEGAIHASSGPLSASIRRILGGFVTQRITEGVDKLLFRLAEPVIFRSLQVANSNVRLNALHLLLDLFPLEDPESTKEAKDTQLDKQFFLLEKLLVDECPGVRVVAVEGCCRILHLFWEIIPSPTITKILTNIFDDMSRDMCSEVRSSTVNGIAYLLGNPQSHEILKVLLSRLGHLILDNVVSTRIAVLDLLLVIRDIRSFQFNKVVALDALLSTLVNDQSQICQKITRLLIPSYLPSKVNEGEACSRCITLIKRSPMAGARFCEFAVSEGASLKHAMELVQGLIEFVLSHNKVKEDQIEGALVASAHLCNSLVSEPQYRTILKEFICSVKAKNLFAAASTPLAQSSVIDIYCTVSPDDVTEHVEECMRLITSCNGVSHDDEMQAEVRSAHKLLMSCDAFDNMFQSLTNILEKTAYRCHVKFGIEMPVKMPNEKRKRGKSAVKSSGKWKHVSGKKASHFEDDYSISMAAAWQIKELLVFEDGQKAVLGSQFLEQAFLALKVISEVTILQSVCCEYMDVEPILAYMLLSLHITLQSVSMGSVDDSVPKHNCAADDGSVLTSQKSVLDQTVDHILNSAERLLEASLDSNSESRPDNIEDDCNGKRQTKHQTDASISNADGLENTKGKRTANKVKMLTAVLKFITDSTAMEFLSHINGRCLTFSSSYLKDIMSTLGEQPREKLSDNVSKDVFICLKSSFSYAAKLLNMILKDISEASEPPIEAFKLVNTMFDLIVSVELQFGSRLAASLITAAKPWLPDLILALGSGTTLSRKEEITSSTALMQVKLQCPSWLLRVAKFEVDQVKKTNSEDGSIPETEEFPAFKRFIDMMVEMLKGSRRVMDSIGLVFLTGTCVGLERREFGLVLGMVHFVCNKLVGKDDREWSQLDGMLASLPSIFPQIEREVEEQNGGEDSSTELNKARELLEPVWLYHVYETGRFCATQE
ncbi:Condensin-2 complex subunit G2 [Linum grandiflorum]